MQERRCRDSRGEGRKEGTERGRIVEGGGGRFYEVDAALVCDELAACLVNSTLSLSLSLSSPSRFIAPLFYNLTRADGNAYVSS